MTSSLGYSLAALVGVIVIAFTLRWALKKNWISIGALTACLSIVVFATWLAFIPRREVPRVQTQTKTFVSDSCAKQSASEGMDRQQIQVNATSVWDRYETKIADLRWAQQLNWYLYTSLRVVAIALGALTPALILWMSTATQKNFTAGAAAVVAICTGLIAGFDFRGETARNSAAIAALESEKARFVAQAGQAYARKQQDTAKARMTACEIQGQQDRDYLVALSAFADRMENIVSEEEGGRLNFLRNSNANGSGTAGQATATPEQTGVAPGRTRRQ